MVAKAIMRLYCMVEDGMIRRLNENKRGCLFINVMIERSQSPHSSAVRDILKQQDSQNRLG